jgi:ribosomal protein S12 methylthiotransferase
MRGRHVSKPLEEIEAEARELAESGVRELVIVAQDTTYYGLDLYGRPRLAELLQRLDSIEDLDWIRLMYFYPMYIDEPLIETMAHARRIVPYLDLPLQHINDQVLRRMSRRVNRLQTESLLRSLRNAIPDLALRTTFITGFPGETEDQFQELLDFVREFAFERMGVFTYSFEPGTPAAGLPDHLPQEVKESRRHRLMEVQNEISRNWNRAQVGKIRDVIVDQPVAGQREAWIARSYADAPDVDGVVWLSGPGIRPGDLVRAEIVAARDYDLIGAKLTTKGAPPGESR